LIVAIPARDEAARLPRALDALAADGVAMDVIVIANGCTDETATVARDFPDLRVAVIETGRLPGGVGEARRRGLRAALSFAPRAGIVATSDADCTVSPDWGATTLRALARAEVACGRVVPDAAEFATLPRIVRRHGNLEDEVAALEAELAGLEDPAPHDPLPRHGQTPGASLAFRTDAYLRAGGFEAVRCHEDRRLVARIAAMGGRIARPWQLCVIASCRTRGRAPGGMADTIAARAADPRLGVQIARLEAERLRLRAMVEALRASSRSFPTPANEGMSDVLSLR
jgi:cellulose synthase/poly-beta-1,6-N-acetylglucosamine synthase-like glycosyltransferase